MAYGIRALTRLAGLDVVDRLGLREPANRALKRASATSFRTAGRVGRTFAATQKRTSPGRLKPETASKSAALFDLTPTDEQQMLQEAARDFAAAEIRPAAEQADHDDKTPQALLDSAAELGLATLGVPEELGGAVEERSAVTSVLIGEALAHGDLGIAVAALAPAAVSTALGLWGDADQQATYLPAFVGEDVPVAALAIQEPQPLFDPFALRTTARRTADGFVLDGVKSLVPRAAEAELFVVAAQLEGGSNGNGAGGPAFFIVESKTKGISTEADPAMGLRAASTAKLALEDVKVPAGALLGGGQPEVYREAIALGRIAWSALAAGTCKAVLDYVIPYVNEREAFGEPISHRQAVAFAVSDIAIETEGLRLVTYRAASRADRAVSFAREAALARRLTADKGMQIGSQGVQLLGGHGYVKDHPVERWYRDLRAAGIIEGTLLV
ncbi:acyl-CoA dehydrogenase family protein [Patulibacter defluvii]|uniref:acyl-CoA dehydrogenase family protein n=1 Tax=Patulibacter defluvii TaxID=3095358 RepID=UPI0035C88A54